jgi:hypothetical protein
MERSEIRDRLIHVATLSPGFAALHPGYGQIASRNGGSFDIRLPNPCLGSSICSK